MAGWLESIERAGSGLFDAVGEAGAERIAAEIRPDAPKDPVNRPETQYDTKVTKPIDGPESKRRPEPLMDTLRDTWATRKWWIVTAAGLAGYLLIKRGR